MRYFVAVEFFATNSQIKSMNIKEFVANIKPI